MIPDSLSAAIQTLLADDVNETLDAIFGWQGFAIYQACLAIIFPFTSKKSVLECVQNLKKGQKPTIKALLAKAENFEKEKWDRSLSRDLLEKAYESTYMDIEAAWNWIISRKKNQPHLKI